MLNIYNESDINKILYNIILNNESIEKDYILAYKFNVKNVYKYFFNLWKEIFILKN